MNVKKVLLVSLVVALSGCGTGPSARREAPGPGYKQVHEKSLVAEDGTLLIKDFSILPGGVLGPKIVGNVVNKTSKDWIIANFEVDLLDRSGNKLGTSIFSISDLKKDQIKPIGILGDGERLYAIRNPDQISAFDLRFRGGRYPAKYIFVLIKPAESRDLKFSDGQLDIRFLPSKKQISFTLLNMTAGPAMVDWNSAAYVDVLGQSHKVMHSGVKFIDKEKPQVPSVIPPGASISDMVFPADYASYTSGKYGGWMEEPLFPDGPNAKDYKGQSFGVFMPIEVNGRVKNYHFVFKVEDVRM